jgi:hypothetical protein
MRIGIIFPKFCCLVARGIEIWILESEVPFPGIGL